MPTSAPVWWWRTWDRRVPGLGRCQRMSPGPLKDRATSANRSALAGWGRYEGAVSGWFVPAGQPVGAAFVILVGDGAKAVGAHVRVFVALVIKHGVRRVADAASATGQPGQAAVQVK